MANTNLFDPVPWLTGGGAQHSTNLGRVVASVAAGGVEGVVGSRDLEVRELSSPGGQVRIYPGVVAVRNRAAGSSGEMYVGRLLVPQSGDPAPERVDISPTSSSGGRTDLIVVRVENPFEAGENWPTPSDPKVGPYIFTRVLQNVPSGTTSVAELGLGYSAVALARVTLPANTSAVTQNMITDLRTLTSSNFEPVEQVVRPAAVRTLTQTSFTNWPSDANLTTLVPDWATHVQAKAILGGIAWGNEPAQGAMRLRLGSLIFPGAATVFDLPSTSGALDRATFMVAGPRSLIPANMRGTTQTAQLEAYRATGAQYSNLVAGATSSIALDLTFLRQPESNVV